MTPLAQVAPWFDCFFAPFERVEEALREHLQRSVRDGKMRIRIAQAAELPATVSRAISQHHIAAFFRPAGWPEGTVRVGRGFWFGQLARRLRSQAVSGHIESDIARFEFFDPNPAGGSQQGERVLQVLEDSGRWQFFSKGEPLPFENLDYYRRRHVRDRLTADIVFEYLRALGVPADSPLFWQPVDTMLVVEETSEVQA